jgi:hypothetical protein
MAAPPDDGLRALCAVRPVLHRIERARDVVSLPGRWLLHAGPPFAAHASLPPPVLASAIMAARYEGWAATDEAAEQLIAAGEVRLSPAQSVDGVAPLAAMVSPSTAVAIVEDANHVGRPAFAPLGTTGGADLRFGTRDATVLDRLRRRDQVEAAILASALEQPIDLLALMRSALGLGDDLHNRTNAATQLLAAELKGRSNDASGAGETHAFLRALEATPLYFLTIAMAAAKRMLMAAEGCAPESLVTALGGNGHVFGMQLAKRPGHWFIGSSTAPRGPRFPQVGPEVPVLNAIGDSAVIDALGLGGHVLAHAPESRAALAGFLPEDFGDLSLRLMSIEHPFFEVHRLRMGLDAQRVVDNDVPPIVTLAMIDAMGKRGLLGRGIFRPSLALFRSALQSIEQTV